MSETAAVAPGQDASKPSAPPPKVDPETLAIRARPRRAIRIKRGAVIALTSAAMAFILLATWVALRHGGGGKGASAQDRSQPVSNPAGDSLNGLAKTYADVPRLGPPLPGDLGKAMADQQQRTLLTPPPAEQQQAAQAAETARQQQVAEAKAALQSGLLVNASAASPVAPAVTAAPAAPTVSSDKAWPLAGSDARSEWAGP